MANGVCCLSRLLLAHFFLHEQNCWLLVPLQWDALVPRVRSYVASHCTDNFSPDLKVIIEIVSRVLVRHGLSLASPAPLADAEPVVEAHIKRLRDGRVQVTQCMPSEPEPLAYFKWLPYGCESSHQSRTSSVAYVSTMSRPCQSDPRHLHFV